MLTNKTLLLSVTEIIFSTFEALNPEIRSYKRSSH